MNKVHSLMSLTLIVFCSAVLMAVTADEFGVKEYDDFHSLLHQLQHEALPKNDLATIRGRATELVTLGQAIVKRGVPEGTKSSNVQSFKKELEKFHAALNQYGADAKDGPDDKLKASYEAVHDSFEMLASMLPRKSAHSGLPHRTVIYDGTATEVAISPTESADLWI